MTTENVGSGSVEEEVMSEVAERSMEANMKILVGNEIAHANRMSVLSETSVADAINLSRKTNDAYLEASKLQTLAYMEQSNAQNKQMLEQMNAQNKQMLEQTNAQNKHILENNRYTLDRLYSVFPEEAVGISTLLKAFESYLKESGWEPPASTP